MSLHQTSWRPSPTVSHPMSCAFSNFALSPCDLNFSLTDLIIANTSFTPVAARQYFTKAAPAPTPTPSANAASVAEKAKRDWPETVRHYVQKAFAVENHVQGISRQDMEIKLKEVISNAVESNTLLTVDWANLPLPQHLILNERTAVTEIHQNPPWENAIAPLTLQETNRKTTDTFSKKRKSAEADSHHQSQGKVPPWQLATNTHNVFEDRISHPEKKQRNDVTGKGTSKSHNEKANRKKRFEDSQQATTSRQPFVPSKVNISQSTPDQGPVVGRCNDLEKKYFRLTSAPNPDSVRPLPVLEKTLELLKKKWKRENNYSYICDQFKSLRQDLTVQHIKNDFTVNVYEIHARIALEKGDLGEYNQCQTQLRALHSQHLGGHPQEFKAYRILYFIHTCNRTDMNDVLADLTPDEKRDHAVKHALDTRSALALGDYHRFFQLYLETPNMGAYLMDMFVARERLAALSNICISYVDRCFLDEAR